LKVLFDATFGESWVEGIRAFFRLHQEPRPRILHLYDSFPRDVKDEEWIPKLVGDDWLIIIADRGKGKAPRLPALCHQYKRTHILLSTTMHVKVNQFNKARAIILLWPKLIEAFLGTAGSCYEIQAQDANHLHFRLISKEIK